MLAWQVNLGLSLELFMEDQMAKSMGPLLQADGLLLCTSITFSALLRSCARAAFRLRPPGLPMLTADFTVCCNSCISGLRV